MPPALKISALIVLFFMISVSTYNYIFEAYSIQANEKLVLQEQLKDQNKTISSLNSKYENFKLKNDLCAAQLTDQSKQNEKIKKLEKELADLKLNKDKIIQVI